MGSEGSSTQRFVRSLALGVGAAFALQASLIAGIIALGAWTGQDPDPFGGSPQALGALLGIAVLQVGVVIAMRRALGVSLAALGWSAPTARDVALGLGGYAVIASTMIGVVIAFGMTPEEIWSTIAGYTPLQRLTFVLVGVLAGFVEESVFRGHLQPLLAARLGPIAGPVLVAIFFDVYHLNFRPASLLMKLGIALVLAFLRVRAGNLAAPAIAHGLVWATLGSL
jgi:membrane protease YdiL (CAAX protease family)